MPRKNQSRETRSFFKKSWVSSLLHFCFFVSHHFLPLILAFSLDDFGISLQTSLYKSRYWCEKCLSVSPTLYWLSFSLSQTLKSRWFIIFDVEATWITRMRFLSIHDSFLMRSWLHPKVEVKFFSSGRNKKKLTAKIVHRTQKKRESELSDNLFLCLASKHDTHFICEQPQLYSVNSKLKKLW